jgi:alginate O-acetyltransferase complex protein AlgI
LSFFPTILAGPITPFREMEPQLQLPANRRTCLEEGATRFIVGLAKKVLIADTLAKTAGAVFAIPGPDLTFPVSWLGIGAYTLQIYFDFSGYTDMAVGLGLIMGFRFMENFYYPYAAISVRDFWTRWHKSLTRWLRDYVFLPLAYKISRAIKGDRWLGVKAESWCYSIAATATMLICGFWHGASWTFVAWGGYHGGALLLERFVWGRRLKKVWRPIQHLYALILIMAGWVLFRSSSFAQAVSFFKAMAGLNRGLPRIYAPALYLDPEQAIALAVGILAGIPLVPSLGRRLRLWRERRPMRHFPAVETAAALGRLLLLAALFILSAMYLAQQTFQPFLYFRF